ncbi:MAG: HEAT repeat domain-containing protein [Deltaproteobacteria bacterium]|nr:HEAT repeat domain-containing protein [Deltaproteobacteria bacterium]
MIASGRRILPIAVLVALTATTAGAAPVTPRDPGLEVDAALATMEHAEGDAYVSARRALLSEGEGIEAELSRRLAAARFSAASFVRDSLTAAALSWRRDADRARRLYELRGLRPEIYLTTPPGRPEVARELKRLALPAPLLAELWLKGDRVYPFAGPGAYPTTLATAERDRLHAEERRALRAGLLVALARSHHPAATPLIRQALADPSLHTGLRAVAAEAAGALGDLTAVPTLLTYAGDPKVPGAIRLGAITGLGKLRASASLEALGRLLARAPDAVHQSAIFAAIASCASPWATPAPAAGLRARAAALVIDRLLAPPAPETATPAIEALAVIRDPGSVAALRAALARADLAPRTRDHLTVALRRVEQALRRQP